MNILYVTHDSGMQGAGFALLNLIKGLNFKDYTPFVVLPGKGQLVDELEALHVRTFIVPYKMDIYPPANSFFRLLLLLPRLIRNLKINQSACRKVYDFARNNNISIIHTNTGVIHWGAEIAKKMQVPHVWHIREFQKLGLNYRAYPSERSFVKKLSHPNNHCIGITRTVFDYYHLKNNKDVVIYDGVFHLQNVLDSVKLHSFFEGKYFLFVGTLSLQKGFFEALDAFMKIAEIDRNVEFWVAGTISEEVNNRVRKSCVSHRIKLLGFRSDVYQLMQGALALLVTSYHEGFGFITAEAMLNHCLVIGRDTAGTKEQFDNGLQNCGCEIGLRFTSPKELVQQMLKVCSMSDGDRLKITEAAHSVLSQYSIEENTRKITSLYTKILER